MSEENKYKKEFENFVYLVSHDFAAPQRHVREFTKLLLESIDADLTEDQRKFRGFIEQGLDKLDRMQSALLNLSRVITQKGDPYPVRAGDIFESVLERLQEKIRTTKSKIHFKGKNIILNVDRTKAEELFFCVMDNALNAIQNTHDPTIEIELFKDDSKVKCLIKDNGIGFSPDKAEDIFTMFRRLHSEQKFGGGIGSGLTIARLIARHHGFDMVAESAGAGAGSTFRFTLPAAE